MAGEICLYAEQRKETETVCRVGLGQGGASGIVFEIKRRMLWA